MPLYDCWPVITHHTASALRAWRAWRIGHPLWAATHTAAAVGVVGIIACVRLHPPLDAPLAPPVAVAEAVPIPTPLPLDQGAYSDDNVDVFRAGSLYGLSDSDFAVFGAGSEAIRAQPSNGSTLAGVQANRVAAIGPGMDQLSGIQAFQLNGTVDTTLEQGSPVLEPSDLALFFAMIAVWRLTRR